MKLICKDCGKMIKEKDIKVKFKAGLCRCKACDKINNNVRYQAMRDSRDKPMVSTAKWTVGKKYSTKGMSVRDTMAVFMDGILAVKDAGVLQND